MNRIAVKIKGKEVYGHVYEKDELCKKKMVYRYFVECGTGRKLYDNFNKWEIKNGELDLYAHPERRRPLIIKDKNFIFIG